MSKTYILIKWDLRRRKINSQERIGTDYLRWYKLLTNLNKKQKRGVSIDKLTLFLISQGYADYQEGKDSILKYSTLHQIGSGIPTNFGSLGGIKKLYGEEPFEKSCKESGEIYNENHLSAEGIQNIEKHADDIAKAGSIKITIEAAEALKSR